MFSVINLNLIKNVFSKKTYINRGIIYNRHFKRKYIKFFWKLYLFIIFYEIIFTRRKYK